MPELFALERFATVITWSRPSWASSRPASGAVDLLAACFPGGSITGAPKVRAMEIIAELEPTRRGLYCGAIGYLGSTARWTRASSSGRFALRGRRGHFGAGGGIVADSDPAAEYEETLDKARALIARRCRRDRMILLIDNYDSFVHNLARYVRELGRRRRSSATTR